MKVIFAGTPEFAACALEQLLRSGFKIVLVLTQPDRPAGRGMKAKASAVKRLALKHRLDLMQPQTLKDPGLLETMNRLSPDVMVVAAYGLILPNAVLQLPRLGCINIHASLLPKWRGAAPIQHALLAGDTETGISIMQMDEGMDTGPVLLQTRMKIAADETAQTLHDRLARQGGEAIVRVLRELERGELHPQRQAQRGASYAAKLGNADAQINWQNEAVQIERAVRAFNPNPGAYTTLNGKIMKIWKARLEDHVGGKPGEIVSVERDSIVVACGVGAMRIEEAQRAGGKRMPAREFLQGFELKPGNCLGA
ncbi:MAG TPA: methionyl-tRNA formyltransferase [Burkholderiales bacterium]|nr:methionyl-tRNA formyltransferase [Burkholderiales bacterium]